MGEKAPLIIVGRKVGMIWLLGFAVLGALALFVRALNLCHERFHPDELIATTIVPRLGVETWDTNWELHPLPEIFRYSQYNFSSYLYFAAVWWRLWEPIFGHSADHAMILHALRAFNLVAVVLSLAVMGWWAARWRGWWFAMVAMLLWFADPLSTMDAHFARVETWLSAVTLLVIVLVASDPKPGECTRLDRRRLVLSGVLIGLAAATKITMVLLVLVPAVVLAARYRRGREKEMVVGLLCLAVPILLGFFLGAPYAVLEPRTFLSGVEFLRAQYSMIHVPFANLDGRPVWTLMMQYWLGNYGTAYCVLALCGAWALCKEGPVGLGMVFLILANVFLFGSRTTFFERNLSPVQPLIALCATFGLVAAWGLIQRLPSPRWLRQGAFAALTIVAVLPMVVLTAKIVVEGFGTSAEARAVAFISSQRAQFPDRELRYARLVADDAVQQHLESLVATDESVLLLVPDYSDPFTEKNCELLVQNPFVSIREVARYEGPFARYPRSTMQDYLGSGFRLFVSRP